MATEEEIRAVEQLIRVRADAPPKLPTWMRYDPILWLIVAAFIAYELVAHFEFHNAAGMRTLSDRVAAFVRVFGWPARIIVILGSALLALHLQGAF